jgi:hypothetical protein
MTDMTTVDVLRAARARIADPDRWTQDGRPRRRRQPVHPAIPARASGARTVRATRRAGPLVAGGCATCCCPRSSSRLPGRPGFNDDPATTHADILALYDDAIRRAAA